MKEIQGGTLLVMARRLNDQIIGKEGNLFLYNHLAFSSQWSARFKREAPLLIIAIKNQMKLRKKLTICFQ